MLVQVRSGSMSCRVRAKGNVNAFKKAIKKSSPDGLGQLTQFKRKDGVAYYQDTEFLLKKVGMLRRQK